MGRLTCICKENQYKRSNIDRAIARARDIRMTVREVEEALGYQPDTIHKETRALEADEKIARIEIRGDSDHALVPDG